MKPYFDQDGITIYNADCRDILPRVGRFDLLLCDPPYGIGEARSGNATRSCLAQSQDYGDSAWDDGPVSLGVLTLAREISNKAIIWGGNYYELPPTPSWLVWDKVNGENDFADCELAWSDLGCACRMFKFMWHGMLREGESRGIPRVHPTQKPVELMLWCISKAKNPQSVIDPFLGSGTTLVACKALGLRGAGIEREEKYCEIAAKRLMSEQASGRARQIVVNGKMESKSLFGGDE